MKEAILLALSIGLLLAFVVYLNGVSHREVAEHHKALLQRCRDAGGEAMIIWAHDGTMRLEGCKIK